MVTISSLLFLPLSVLDITFALIFTCVQKAFLGAFLLHPWHQSVFKGSSDAEHDLSVEG